MTKIRCNALAIAIDIWTTIVTFEPFDQVLQMSTMFACLTPTKPIAKFIVYQVHTRLAFQLEHFEIAVVYFES